MDLAPAFTVGWLQFFGQGLLLSPLGVLGGAVGFLRCSLRLYQARAGRWGPDYHGMRRAIMGVAASLTLLVVATPCFLWLWVWSPTDLPVPSDPWLIAGMNLCWDLLRRFPTPWVVVTLLCLLSYVLWLVIWVMIADVEVSRTPGWAILGCGEFVAWVLWAGQAGLAGVRRRLRPVVRALRAAARVLGRRPPR